MDEFFGFARELLEKGRAKIADIYANAELYDLLVQSELDAQFYLQLAKRRGGRVLDLACGSGRIIPSLLDAGLEISALDLAPKMLARAKTRLGSRASEVEFVLGDMRNFSFARPFDTIMIPYCSLMYMHNDEDRKRVFQCCHENLKPGGYLAFDFLAGEVELGEGFPTLAMQGIHPFTGDILLSVVQVLGVAHDLRLLNQINYVLPEVGGAPSITVFSSKEAVVDPKRITELLRETEFTIEGVYNNHLLHEYNGGEECLILAQKFEDEC